MDALASAAASYKLAQEGQQVTLDDLQDAFISGAKWMVEDKTEKKKQDKEQKEEK